ncbi:hypothetical protein SNOG_12057 [Parastagonospora nodorum SN15]|uniref:Uncharacterized protein n=1 Tax=Phaeosphaeria nodorum (strain SN15 / ATCC MYA-4574 / FGSC 10173) TaxID=321614 RepID=Q0U857_PHANO|nr:hypothetical protein SNOG_12057 [Parastagonospora nodorum SN15]EAT80469.2 hypothetical protein SNOG_12057 [Parastagonospora nodorum SN15]
MRRSVSRNSPDCAKCARDVSAHVTRPIDNSTPYDQATPPPPPPNNIRTQTPRSSGGVKGLPATDVPRQTAACPHTPRPADHLVARDDLHYDNRKPGPSSGKEATLAPSSQNTQDSLKQNTSVPVTKPLSLFDTTKSDHLQDIVPERPTTPRYNKPQPARYRGVDNMPAITMTAPRLPMFPKAAPKPRPAKLDLAPLVVESVENPNIPRRQLSWSARHFPTPARPHQHLMSLTTRGSVLKPLNPRLRHRPSTTQLAPTVVLHPPALKKTSPVSLSMRQAPKHILALPSTSAPHHTSPLSQSAAAAQANTHIPAT